MQVSTATCVDDPLDEYNDITVAIVKIKYQYVALTEVRHATDRRRIHGTRSTTARYESEITEAEEYLAYHPESVQEIERDIAQYNDALRLCHTATHHLNGDMLTELQVLRHLSEQGCTHAPELLNLMPTTVRPKRDTHAVVGGYLVFIIMTRVSGEAINFHEFCKLPLAERDEIREKFREALM